MSVHGFEEHLELYLELVQQCDSQWEMVNPCSITDVDVTWEKDGSGLLFFVAVTGTTADGEFGFGADAKREKADYFANENRCYETVVFLQRVIKRHFQELLTSKRGAK